MGGQTPGGLITSSGGDVTVTGTGGNNPASEDYGVFVDTQGTMTAGNTGKVNVFGTGGAGSGGSNYGVTVVGFNAS